MPMTCFQSNQLMNILILELHFSFSILYLDNYGTIPQRERGCHKSVLKGRNIQPRTKAYLAFWELFSNSHSPYPSAISAVKYPTWSRNRWKDKSIFEYSVQDVIDDVMSFDFPLIVSAFCFGPQARKYLVNRFEVSLVCQLLSSYC